MLAIVASALVIVGASFIFGRAFLFVLGRTRPTWLSGAVGFALLVVACPLAIHLPGRAKTTAVLVALAAVAAILVMRRRFFAERQDPEAESPAPRAAHAAALATVLITLVLACLPFALNASTGVLGEGVYTNDQAAQLYWTDWLQNGDGPEPSAVRFGYPTGPQALTAATAEVTGASLEHAFNGLLVAIAILGALAALSALGELEPRRRVAAAVLSGLPYLAASYLAQSAFKETAMALLVLALAIVLSELSRGVVARRAGVGAVIALAAASVFTYSLPGLAWFAAAIPIWIFLELARGGGQVQADVAAGVAAMRRHRRPMLAAGLALVVIVVLGIGPVHHFFTKISDVQSSPGRLGSPISPGEALGVWPQGDFRIVRGDVTGSIPAILIGLLAIGVGVGVALRRRQNGLLAVLVAGAAVYLAARIDASIYVQAKALAVIAPTIAFAAFAGLLTPSEGGWPASRPVRALAVVFTVGVLVSTLLALRAAPVGFDNNARDLESLAQRIQGRKVVFLGLDRFAAYWLRGTLIEAPGGYVPPDVKPRHDKPWFQGRPVDFDTMSPQRLDRYRYAITTTAAFQSTPPPHMSMVEHRRPLRAVEARRQDPAPARAPRGPGPRGRAQLRLGLRPGDRGPEGNRDDAAQAGPRPLHALVAADLRRARQRDSALDLTPGKWQLSLQYNSQVKTADVSAGRRTQDDAALARRHVSPRPAAARSGPRARSRSRTRAGRGHGRRRRPAAALAPHGRDRSVWLGNIAATRRVKQLAPDS